MFVIHFITGCVVGSFLCLVAERIPVGKSILNPPSHCSSCQTPLKIFELIPIISIIFLRFRCRYCHYKLSPIYFMSELICGLLFIVVPFDSIQPCYSLFLLLTAVVLSLTDIFYLIVAPRLFYPLAFFLCAWHIYLALPIYFFTSFAIFISLYGLTKIYPDSIGGGDIILLVLLGALLGYEPLIFLLFCASSSGLLFLLVYQSVFQKKIRRLPFVPFLTIGLFCVFLCK
ncbi:hypothetical protein UAY_00035 [Enterococcus moraviensis ATCC BAA-383]|uniref:Uncharacterized protein n=1 Tax=Enterococcus moraviensis ATCC BAA-383 TaxID=1158609 RepID=R2THN6_9ENTE|nr:A24 family peptidase [Enterococcus moraviensis]EOI06693.1 hypothetical protein UAY_00035 [Enterococcus moraviensis ATCC BAA-383]EOT65030.1 hypothetical protein I586_02764 [Enterococcus moraviensis ATCC BAA-383]OJG66876.1 hypothetical protein RV09_GL003093 [Enterococcus moraviensis]